MATRLIYIAIIKHCVACWCWLRDSRFEDVDEETKAKVLRENLAMRLRMILEAKKDGRMKGRLVGQGFLETRLCHSMVVRLIHQ